MLSELSLKNKRSKSIGMAGVVVTISMLSAATTMAQTDSTNVLGEPNPISVQLSQIGQPVPSSVIVEANGLEWVWASPGALNGGYTNGIDVGHDGFVFATQAQWALRPPIAAFRNPDKCASPWFDYTYNNCDWGDAALEVYEGYGTYGSAPTEEYPAGPDGNYPMHPLGETWLVRIANEPPTADAGGPYLTPVNGSVMFDGSGSSDPDGNTLSYAWTADGGSLNDATLQMPTYTADSVPGIWNVTLTVNDGTVDSRANRFSRRFRS
jgi:hypothetical protein